VGTWEDVAASLAALSGGQAETRRARGPAWRQEAVRALADERFDVLIVGGGVVGAGALLDATSRGLKAALVEQRDIASGTSGRSSRLIHGGLRYLEQLHFGLVYEALQERARLLRLAPHLVTLEPFLFPIYGIPLLHQGFYGSGIFLYDLLGARRDGGFAKHLRPSSAMEWAPLRRKGLTGGIICLTVSSGGAGCSEVIGTPARRPSPPSAMSLPADPARRFTPGRNPGASRSACGRLAGPAMLR